MPSFAEVVGRSVARGTGAAAVAVLLTLATHAGAVGTRTFTLDTREDYEGGDLKGAAVGSDGFVRAGWTLGSTPLEGASAVFCALPLADGSTLVGTSPGGKVFRVAGDVATVHADTGELAVTSMVVGPGGAVFAATIPSGKIFRLTPGKAQEVAKLPAVEHVWALAVARGTLFAATGPEGKLFRVLPDGTSSVYFDSDEPNLVALATDEATGDLLVGTSGKATAYRVSGPGRATVLYDFPGEEVKALVVARGSVYALSNEYGEPPEPPKRNPAAGRTPAGPSTAARPKPGKGTLWRFDAQGRPEKMMHHDDTHYTALAVDDAGVAHVGTGAEGRVYAVDDAHVVTLLTDTDERQVGALSAAAKATYVASSDPAVFHRLVARGGPEAVWTSRAFDAGLRARWGKLQYRASGPLEVSSRTGNSAKPDGTWSPWSGAIVASGQVESPAGRYVQLRARWARDPNATLGEVVLPFVTDNLRPVVTEVSALQKGTTRESKEGVAASGGDLPKHDTVVKVAWKVDNPDSDALRYRVAFRRDGQTVWRDVHRPDEIVTKTEYEWDTQALPEGKYRVRVEASDEPANPPDQVQRHALESATVLIDNTPPVVRELSVRGGRLRAHVVDLLGPIARAEIAVNGRLEWRPLAPVDGIFDAANETIDADVSAVVPAGTHIVALRVFDAAGNPAVQEVESRP